EVALPGGEWVGPGFDREAVAPHLFDGELALPAVVAKQSHRRFRPALLALGAAEDAGGEDVGAIGEDVGLDGDAGAANALDGAPSAIDSGADVFDYDTAWPVIAGSRARVLEGGQCRSGPSAAQMA